MKAALYRCVYLPHGTGIETPYRLVAFVPILLEECSQERSGRMIEFVQNFLYLTTAWCFIRSLTLLLNLICIQLTIRHAHAIERNSLGFLRSSDDFMIHEGWVTL